MTLKRKQRFIWSSTGATCVIVLSIGLLVWAPAEASKLPGIAACDDFELIGDYVFELDGRELTDAEIYLSESQVTYLVVAPELASPLLISPRGKSVQTIDADLLSRKEGSAELAARAAREYAGAYELEHGAMVFELDGKTAKLKPKPPLLGRQTFTELDNHDPSYGHKARAHKQAKAAAVAAPPVADREIIVRTYFGSWSKICKLLVPRMKRLEDAWRTSGIRFEYYGLPRPIPDDLHAVDLGIRGVPTTVVFADGEEIGRLTGRALDAPEDSLYRLLEEGSR